MTHMETNNTTPAAEHTRDISEKTFDTLLELEEKLKEAKQRIIDAKELMIKVTKECDQLETVAEMLKYTPLRRRTVLEKYGINKLFMEGAISGWEYRFCADLLPWKGKLTDKQTKKLDAMAIRLRLTEKWNFYNYITGLEDL